MTAKIISLEAYRSAGNGAREAMGTALAFSRPLSGDILTEAVLMQLWNLGFKVVPLDEKDKHNAD